jgi:hypothetical protein
VLCLVRTVNRYADVSSLLGCELSEMHTDLLEVKACHLLVEVLRQAIYVDRILLVEELNLC